MKQLLFSFLLLSVFSLKAQHDRGTEGTFMDTLQTKDSSCVNDLIYYYSVDAKYFKNSASLLKDAQVYLQATEKKYSGNGYITFRCRIGCDGKPANKIQILQTDEVYRSAHFEKELVNELYGFFKTLDRWKRVKNKNGQPISYIAFITFKIKDGKIIQIIP